MHKTAKQKGTRDRERQSEGERERRRERETERPDEISSIRLL